jgi:MFS family permease
VLLLSMVAVGMGQTLVFAVIPMLGRELKLHEIMVALPWGGSWQPRELAITSLSAMSALVFSLVAPAWGRLSDRIGRKPVLLVGMVGYTVGTLLFSSAGYAGLSGLLSGALLYFALLITRLLQATIMSAASPTASAYMVDVTDVATRTRGLSHISSANQIGAVAGPALAYFAVISFLAPLLIQAAMSFVCAVLIALLLRESRPAQVQTVAITRAARQQKLSVFDSRYRIYLLGGFGVFCCFAMVQQTLGFYFQDRLHLNSVDASRLFSYAMMLSSACMIFAQVFVVQRVALGPFALMRIGLPLSSLGYGLLAFAHTQTLLFVGMALFGIGFGLAGPGYSAGATLNVDGSEQGELAGLMGSAAGLGFVMGPLAGGVLYQLNSSLPYSVAAVALLPMICFVWFVKE